MKLILFLSILLVSCGSVNELVDNIEQPHRALYRTKALYAIGSDQNSLILQSPTGQAVYLLKTEVFKTGDTIVLNDHPEIFCQLKFTRFKNMIVDDEGYYCEINNNIYFGYTLSELNRNIKRDIQY